MHHYWFINTIKKGGLLPWFMIPCIKSCMCKQYLMELSYKRTLSHLILLGSLWPTRSNAVSGILEITQRTTYYSLMKIHSFRHGKPLLSVYRSCWYICFDYLWAIFRMSDDYFLLFILTDVLIMQCKVQYVYICPMASIGQCCI